MKLEEIVVGQYYWCCDRISGGTARRSLVEAIIPPREHSKFHSGGFVVLQGQPSCAIPVDRVMAKVVW